MVSTHPVISKSSSPCTNPLVTVPRVPITIGIIIIIIIIYSFRVFHISVSWWSFTGVWVKASLLQSPGLFSLFWPFYNAVVWMVSTRPPTSKFSSPFNNPFVTVSKAAITIGIIIIFMFHSFFNSLARAKCLSFFSHSFSFILWSAGTAKSAFLQVLFFLLLITIRSGLLAEIRWSVCISKSQKSLFVPFSRTGAGLCIYHLFVWWNLNFLRISPWITFTTQSCLVLYSFCANLQYSLMMWLIVSFLSPHNLHLLFCFVLSILALIRLVLMALFCAAIRRDSVSLSLKVFLFFNQVLVFPCEILLISSLKRP